MWLLCCLSCFGRLNRIIGRQLQLTNSEISSPPRTIRRQTLAQELIKEDIIALLLLHFPVLPFEARKDTVRVFQDLAYHNWSGFADPYLSTKRFDIVEQLVLVRSRVYLSTGLKCMHDGG